MNSPASKLPSRSDVRQGPAASFVVWWVLWAAILAGCVMVYLVFGRKPAPATAGGVLLWLGLGPLAVSLVIRWLVLPRVILARQAFVVFIIGLSMADAAVIFASFLSSGSPRDMVAGLGLLGLIQWMPLFAGKFVPSASSTRL